MSLTYYSQILADPKIQTIISRLRQIWGNAEYLLELDFARKVIAGGLSVSRCQQTWEMFLYLDQ